MAEAYVMKTMGQWRAQAVAAQDAIRDKNGGTDPATLADADKVDHVQFGLLIEAMVALEPYTGRPVSDELCQLAGLRPVAEVLGLP